MDEHLAKGTSVGSRQEWDMNSEGPGKILLKSEKKYCRQNNMKSIITKNERGEIINTVTSQTAVEEEAAKICGKKFADEQIESTEQISGTT